MGEYAIRKSDGQEIRLGTCERMAYIRYEDRFKVSQAPHSLNCQTTHELWWRLPFPDEDHIKIGEYEGYARGFRLYHKERGDFPVDDSMEPGTIQLRHECGLLINVKCHHGAKLPDLEKNVRVFWNGKTHSIELFAVKNMENGELKPLIRCRHCDKTWRCEWEEVLPYVFDAEFKSRLIRYTVEHLMREKTAV